MRRKRILYIARYSTGGSIESLLCLIQGLDKQRFQPTVLFYHPPAGYKQERFEAAGARVIHLYPGQGEDPGPGTAGGGLGAQAKIRRWLGVRSEDVYASCKSWYRLQKKDAELVRDLEAAIGLEQPDLVHLNNDLVADLAGIEAARQAYRPAICHVRAFSDPNAYHRYQARRLQGVVCISRAIQEHLVASGLPAKLTHVVHNPVDLQRFSLAEQSAEQQTERPFTAVVIGRLDHWKGQDDFLEAMAIVARQIPSSRGLIVGNLEPTAKNRAYLNKLEQLHQDLDLEQQVKFTGERQDVPEILAQADVAVLSSSSPEPFGRVIIEAMAIGTPVVATAAGGVLDIIRDGENGLLVPRRNPEAMAAAILRLAAEPDLAARLRSSGRQTVEADFSIDTHVRRISSIYEEILDRMGGSTGV